MRLMRFLLTACLSFICCNLLYIADLSASETGGDDGVSALKKLNIEDLMNLEVTLVSRKSEKLSEVPAAVYVITAEDIRRSGATNIPDALRMVPGLQVTRFHTIFWGISSRGFNDRFSNKLLVQIDGRTIYSSIFSGVIWDRQDVLLEDVERIEVVRGPGASMWGANAVNGIINIVTKSAKDTQGGLISGGTGTEENGFASFRYGGTVNENIYYRVYAKTFDRDELDTKMSKTGWKSSQAGFRVDWEPSKKDSVTIQGDIYKTERGAYSNPGMNVLGRWNHVFSDTSDMSLRLYYDRVSEYVNDYKQELIDTFDMDFQQRFRPVNRHEITWGIGARFINDNLANAGDYFFYPEKDKTRLYSAFLQDEVTLIKNKLRFIAGSKFEHNDYTGFEIQPNARMVWTPDSRNTVWAAISRAVRTPSRAEYTISMEVGQVQGASVMILGDSGFESEDLVAYELGYRVQPSEKIFFDIAAFYNIYNNLLTLEQGELFFDGQNYIVPIYPRNKMDGQTYGIEVATDWQPVDWWHFKASYAYLQMQLRPHADSTDTVSESAEGKSPHNQFSVRSMMNITRRIEFDTTAYYVGSLPAIGVESYLSVDVRLGWKPVRNLDVSAVCKNIFDDRHIEFRQTPLLPVTSHEVGREIYLKTTWQF